MNDDVVQTFSTSAGSLVPYNEWVPWETALGGVHGRLVLRWVTSNDSFGHPLRSAFLITRFVANFLRVSRLTSASNQGQKRYPKELV